MDNYANAPASVTVVFPKADYGVPTGADYTITVAGTGHAGTEVIRSTAVANFLGGASPANIVELQALADQIAADFYAWRLGALEVRYESIVPWVTDGFHDIEYRHDRAIMTAVHRSTWEPDVYVFRHSGTYTAIPPGSTYYAIANGDITGASTSFTAVATLSADIVSLLDGITVSLSSVAALPEGFDERILIDNEEMEIRVSGGVVTAFVRGSNGTVAATHTAGVIVYRVRQKLGEGLAHLIRAALQSDGGRDEGDTGFDAKIYNSCSRIANGTRLELYLEPFERVLMVDPQCIGLTPGSGTGTGSGAGFGICQPTPDLCLTFGGVDPNYVGGDAACFGGAAVTLSYTPGGNGSKYVWSGILCDTPGITTLTFDWEPGVGAYTIRGVSDTSSWYLYGEVSWNGVCDPFNMTVPTITVGQYGDASTGNPTAPCQSSISQAATCTTSATITRGACGIGGSTPTVDFDTTAICSGAPTITITGTNFAGDGSDTVTFNLGAAGTVTSFSGTTSITVTFSAYATGSGALKATVNNVNGTSAPAVQVATVDCAIGAGAATVTFDAAGVSIEPTWWDTFTDANSTNLNAHTPDVSPGGSGYTTVTGSYTITGNAIVINSGNNNYSFDPGLTTTASARLDFSLADTTVHGIIELNPPGISACGLIQSSGSSWDIYADSVLVGSIALINSNVYTLEVVCDGSDVTVTVNGNGGASGNLATMSGTVWHLACNTNTVQTMTIDNLIIYP